MYIKRILEKNLKEVAKEFGAVAIMGPRQSGKTTLAKHVFPNHEYVSLEDFDKRERANLDPRGFLNDYPTVGNFIEWNKSELILPRTTIFRAIST